MPDEDGATVEVQGWYAPELRPPYAWRKAGRQRWPLDALVAYVIAHTDGDIDAARADLGRGEAHDTLRHYRNTWAPMTVADAEIERVRASIPAPLAEDERGIAEGLTIVNARLASPPDASGGIVVLRIPYGPTVWRMMGEAAYVGFNKMSWLDHYERPVARDELEELYADAVPRGYFFGPDLAKCMGTAAPPYVHQFAIMELKRRPGWRGWMESLSDRRTATRTIRWYRSIFGHATARLGAALLIDVCRRGSECPPWDSHLPEIVQLGQ